eukprot:4077957-Alexandrium_andersonii.AAC.1
MGHCPRSEALRMRTDTDIHLPVHPALLSSSMGVGASLKGCLSERFPPDSKGGLPLRTAPRSAPL